MVNNFLLGAAFYLEEKGENDVNDSWANNIFKPFVLELAEGFHFDKMDINLKNQRIIQVNPCHPKMDDDMTLDQVLIGIAFQQLAEEFKDGNGEQYFK